MRRSADSSSSGIGGTIVFKDAAGESGFSRSRVSDASVHGRTRTVVLFLGRYRRLGL
jgi:hypothetical protein